MVPDDPPPEPGFPVPDDLAGAFGDLPEAPSGLLERLERATARRVRRRAIRRRAAVVAALLAAYVGGLATTYRARGAGPVVPAAEPPRPATAAPARPAPPAPTDVAALARALRERGDRLLREDGDVEGALACYREHLELASLAGRPAPDADDSWLLTALKNDLR